jgi:hypothetical protein
MLLFADAKKLEKAIGTEATEVLVKILESQDEAMRKDLATKADLAHEMLMVKADVAATKTELELKLAETKAELIKWVAGLLLAQSAIIAALVKLLAK